MVVRIASMVVRICGVLLLILGILLWLDIATSLVLVHMLLGIILTIALWVLGVVIATSKKGGSIGLGIGAIVLGLIVVGLGLTQQGILAQPGDPHWIIQVLHLLLGLLAIGMAEMISGRYRRSSKLA